MSPSARTLVSPLAASVSHSVGPAVAPAFIPAPTYGGPLAAGNFTHNAVVPVTTVINNLLPPPRHDPNVVHCNPHPREVTLTRDSTVRAKREKRLQKHTRKVPPNTLLPFGIVSTPKYDRERYPGWYDNRNYHAGPAAPFLTNVIM